MRPVTLYEKPPFPPYVCISCGVGEKPRKWFIDIGLSLDYYFNPVNDGTVFFCDECFNNLKVQAERCVNNWVAENEAWDSPDRVAATYKWKSNQETAAPVGQKEVEKVEEDDVRGSEPTDTERIATIKPLFGSRADSGSEGDDSDSEFINSGDEPDDDAKESYTAIFGEPPEPD